MKTTGVIAALKRARVPILTVAATYAGFLLLGMAFVHAGNGFALRERDAIVNRAYARDPAAIAFKQNRRLRAAALDFTRNRLLGAVPNTIGGIAIVLPYPIAGYRGWVGASCPWTGDTVAGFLPYTPPYRTWELYCFNLSLIRSQVEQACISGGHTCGGGSLLAR